MYRTYSTRSIKANFKDGKPHGVAKFTLSDTSLFIGNFHYGVRHGFYRMWEKGDLKRIGFYENGRKIGTSWTLHGSSKVFYDGEESLMISNDGKVTSGETI